MPLLSSLREQAPAPARSTLYRTLAQRAYTYLLPRYGDHARPILDEAIQDALLIFWRKQAAATEPILHPEAYAYGIIRLTFFDYMRRNRRPEFACDPGELPSVAATATAPPPSAERFFQELAHPPLWRWYRCLPTRHRQLLQLRLQGYKDREIAEQLGLHHGSVRNTFGKLLQDARALVPLAA